MGFIHEVPPESQCKGGSKRPILWQALKLFWPSLILSNQYADLTRFISTADQYFVTQCNKTLLCYIPMQIYLVLQHATYIHEIN